MAYNKFNELTRWQKFRLVGVSVGLIACLLFIIGLIAKIGAQLVVWGFNLIPWV